MTSRGDNLGDFASNRCLIHRDVLKSLFTLWTSIKQGALFGAHSAREIPVTIPNTEVKPGSADYTTKVGN